MAEVVCVLGNQLFSPRFLPLKPSRTSWIFMREDRELCTHFKYHKHKIIFFLSAMRKYAAELENEGYQIHYEKLSDSNEKFEACLLKFLEKMQCKTLQMFEIEDKFFETRLQSALANNNVKLSILPSPMFLTSRTMFNKLTSKSKKPFMKTFYEAQRKHLKILVHENGQPVGDKWSFDEENRKPLPKDHDCPKPPRSVSDAIDAQVFKVVDLNFADHPGRSEDFWLPTDRVGAQKWAKDFFAKRFYNFGAYEDALSKEEPFVYHSVLSPFLNIGLLTPKDCISLALKTFKENSIPLNSVEGYIRQMIGWREFVRGIYQNYSDVQESKNHFDHRRKLSSLWYKGETGVPPLDDVIEKVKRFGYAHHIERLMVVGSLMVLLEVDPKEAHSWFMEMFVDSSDWVMGPNVYGMALFSDGGIFATKPYICGSNYYRKMSKYPAGEWCDAVDGLYWTFIQKNKEKFSSNPRMSMMIRALEKIPVEKMRRISKAANLLRQKLVI